MMIIILLTILVVAIPTLYLLNSKYVQNIALFIGVSQIALLVFNGKIDNQLSQFLVNSFNNVVSFSYSAIIQKIGLLLFTL